MCVIMHLLALYPCFTVLVRAEKMQESLDNLQDNCGWFHIAAQLSKHPAEGRKGERERVRLVNNRRSLVE